MLKKLAIRIVTQQLQRLGSVRLRFALALAALLLLVLSAFGGFVYWSVGREISDAITASLRLSSVQMLAVLDGEGDLLSAASRIPSTFNDDVNKRGFTIWVRDQAGDTLQAAGSYRDLPPAPASLAAAREGRTDWEERRDPRSNERVRIYTTPINRSGQLWGIVQVAQDLHEVDQTRKRLLRALLLSAPVLVLAAAGSGYLLAAQALAPIDRITRTAQRISANDLHARINLPATNDEVSRLASTFDQMLARLDDAFQRERQFTADASHELRTPLAAMQAILSVTRARRRSAPDYEQALDDLLMETGRLRNLVEALLELARSDTHQQAAHEQLDLATLLRDVADALHPLAEEKQLLLRYDLPDQLMFCGDSDGLIRLFLNLLDNAISYTATGCVALCAEATPAGIQVLITDTGVGIAAEHLPHLFDRFYRVERSRSSGNAGLGLAIAQAIVRAHNGTITVESSPSVGTTVRVLLPMGGQGRVLLS